MITNKHKALLVGICTLLAIGSQPAQAVLITAGDFTGSDCAGFFGANFDVCTVFVTDNGDTIELSPVIAKFNTPLPATPEINSTIYPTVDGSEFSFNPATGDPNAGTWTYNPAADDPGIKYWVAKAGNDFKLFWEVEAGDVESPCSSTATDQTNYNLACLNEALVQTSNTWSTPEGKALSHITFYNTEPVSTTSNGGGQEEVPEPGVLALLGMGLLAGLLARRRFTS